MNLRLTFRLTASIEWTKWDHSMRRVYVHRQHNYKKTTTTPLVTNAQ